MQVGEKHISRDQARPHPKGAGPQRTQNVLGPLPMTKRFDLVLGTKFGILTRGWCTSVLLGGRSAYPKIVGTPYQCQKGLTYSDESW